MPKSSSTTKTKIGIEPGLAPGQFLTEPYGKILAAVTLGILALFAALIAFLSITPFPPDDPVIQRSVQFIPTPTPTPTPSPTP